MSHCPSSDQQRSRLCRLHPPQYPLWSALSEHLHSRIRGAAAYQATTPDNHGIGITSYPVPSLHSSSFSSASYLSLSSSSCASRTPSLPFGIVVFLRSSRHHRASPMPPSTLFPPYPSVVSLFFLSLSLVFRLYRPTEPSPLSPCLSGCYPVRRVLWAPVSCNFLSSTVVVRGT